MERQIRRRNRKFIILWAIFFIYFFCYMTMEIDLRVLLSIWSIGLSVYILIKIKLPSKKRIITSVLFAALVSIAYLGIQMGINVVIMNGIIAGIPTLLCSLAHLRFYRGKGISLLL